MKWIRSQKEIAVDTETTGLGVWTGDRVIGISISDDRTAYYFPFGHNEGYNLPRNLLAPLAVAMMSVPHWIMFNAKFDVQMLHQDGLKRPTGWEDVMLSAHLMNENEPSFALKRLADRYFGAGTSSDEAELTREIKSRFGQKAKKGEIYRLPSEIVAPYACADTLLTYRLRDFYRPHLATWELTQLNEEVQAYNQLLNKIETHGVQLDMNWIATTQEQTKPTLNRIEQQINDAIGYKINPNSPIQLKEYFGTAGTAKEILEALENPVAELVLEYRAWKKIDSTYLTSYINLTDPSGVIHATFNPHGTVAGRLSSSNPNLQNVPKQVRRAFVPREGCEIVEMDYQAAEMRLAAHYSRSPRLVKIFRENGDPHQMVANELSESLGISISRQRGKIGNFGKIYGMGANGFSKKFNSTLEEGRQFVDAYDERFPEIRGLYYGMQNQAASKGYIRLPTGRVRRYPAGNFHTAMNNLIQGTAAEVVRFAMTRIAEQLPEATMLLQVHDSILFELPKEDVHTLIPEIKHLMEDFNFDPRMLTDVNVGSSWGSLEEYSG